MKVKLQKMWSMKVEEELEVFVGSNMRGERKLDDNVSTKLLTGSDVFYCSKSILKSPGRRFFLSFPYWAFLIMTV